MHLVYTPLSAFLCDIETYKIDLHSSLDVDSHRNYMKLTKHPKKTCINCSKRVIGYHLQERKDKLCEGNSI